MKRWTFRFVTLGDEGRLIEGSWTTMGKSWRTQNEAASAAAQFLEETSRVGFYPLVQLVRA